MYWLLTTGQWTAVVNMWLTGIITSYTQHMSTDTTDRLTGCTVHMTLTHTATVRLHHIFIFIYSYKNLKQELKNSKSKQWKTHSSLWYVQGCISRWKCDQQSYITCMNSKQIIHRISLNDWLGTTHTHTTKQTEQLNETDRDSDKLTRHVGLSHVCLLSSPLSVTDWAAEWDSQRQW